MAEFIEMPLEYAAASIDLIGIAILLIAAVKFLFHYAAFEIGRVRGFECVFQIRDLRLRLGSYILLALEFMIISDVIHSALSRTLDDFLILGAVVLIRSALSFFLGLDLKDTREQQETSEKHTL
ncbi:MAG: DUF1622 domain-containing protein [Candidatus Latescibacteria bacterium]|nr:DUF1622 domain-containing protein [Candidatus Latescibacterota bacterium]